MSGMLFGNSLRAENFKVVSIPADCGYVVVPLVPVSGDTPDRGHRECLDRMEDLSEVEH